MPKKKPADTQRKYPTEGFARAIEAAEFLALSDDTVYRMARDGELPSQTFRGAIRIPWQALHALMPSGK